MESENGDKQKHCVYEEVDNIGQTIVSIRRVVSQGIKIKTLPKC